MRAAIQAAVVVLIVTTCGGLIVSAVLKVRGAAARVQCLNNLRQLGLSVQNYHDSNEHYPRAAMPNADLPTEKRLSWLVELMPYIEANDIYSRMDKGASWDAEKNRFAAELPIKVFHCPGHPEGASAGTSPATHYLGITGVGEGAAELPAGDPRAGFFGYERELRKKDLPRGESQTAMIAETAAVQGTWTAAGLPTVRGFDPDTARFGGNHRGGCQVVFADGSVRMIDVKTSEAEWRRLVALAEEPSGE
jgi:prepilin-type processing-associated H-X9-DG protein